jgi:predicted transposase/invertase (TIGR01784 family)
MKQFKNVNIMKSMIVESKEVYADPTLDVTFKMLFGQEKNTDILISLLNSLLNFTGDKEIVSIEINSSELPVSFLGDKTVKSGITSAVDILCTNKGKQKIAIEMQGQAKNYFLTREQEYMAKLISGQVKDGEGQQYHNKVLDTYILVLGKQNMFPEGSISNNKLFEIDVKPVIIQTNEIYPGNKMHWKFYELPKFKKSVDFKNMCKDSDIKYQWLEFLVKCTNQVEEPDRNNLIKKGYDIMKIAKWDEDTKNLYWKEKMNEIDAIQQIEFDKEEVFKEGMMKGIKEGKWKGEVKGEIKQIKFGLKYKMDEEKIVEYLKFLNKDNFPYIKEHIDDTESVIMGGMEIEYQNDI